MITTGLVLAFSLALGPDETRAMAEAEQVVADIHALARTPEELAIALTDDQSLGEISVVLAYRRDLYAGTVRVTGDRHAEEAYATRRLDTLRAEMVRDEEDFEGQLRKQGRAEAISEAVKARQSDFLKLIRGIP